ncbi:MAG TPA: polysaccharide deacetylase family protein [Sedimentisphaerales bacterium]|nr:polysaccharide deacetylase family protein [Sedimentisphaerales bacterium]
MKNLLSNISTRRLLKETLVDTCLILQYHRVGQFCYDPLQWAVDPYKFESQMEYLANNCNVISIDEMKQHIEAATPFPQQTVVVTFDGGYADILYAAREILERYHIPAIVFSTSANIVKPGLLWWDTLEDYFVANRSIGKLEVEINEKIVKWPLKTQIDKFRAYYDLYSILIDKAAAEQQDVLNQIIMSVDLQADELDDHRIINAQELKELDESDFISIGGHTHNGVKLSSLNQWQQTEEILKNKEILEEVLSHKIEYFSYPFGNDSGCDPIGMSRILKDNEFSIAAGDSYGVVDITRKMNLYDLPRVRVGNWNEITFHTFLESFWGSRTSS